MLLAGLTIPEVQAQAAIPGAESRDANSTAHQPEVVQKNSSQTVEQGSFPIPVEKPTDPAAPAASQTLAVLSPMVRLPGRLDDNDAAAMPFTKACAGQI